MICSYIHLSISSMTMIVSLVFVHIVHSSILSFLDVAFASIYPFLPPSEKFY